MTKNELSLELPNDTLLSKIHITDSLLEDDALVSSIKKLASHFVLLTDSTIAPLVLPSLLEKLASLHPHFTVLTLPSGEKNKSRETKAWIEDQLLERHLGRDTLLIAVGGGMVSDLVGFTASTYCRSIPYITIPTTLLSMVDASIGGKTAINVSSYKNMIGSFYFPKHVWIDPCFLSTLPEHEWRNGLAEIIKYGLIASPAILDKLQKPGLQNTHWVQELIHLSCACKCSIVQQDPYEKGIRRILNFGHTIGHGIESTLHFTISHGEAIAMGMGMEAYMSHKMGLLSQEDLSSIIHLLKTYGFSLKLPSEVQIEELKNIMQLDKKSTSKHPRFVVLEGLGRTASFHGEYCTLLNDSLFEDALQWNQKL